MMVWEGWLPPAQPSRIRPFTGHPPQTAAIELREAGIRVNAICPSFIKTEMVDRLVKPFEAATGANFDDLTAQAQGRLGTPEEVAEMAAFLASDAASFVTGSYYILDNALTASTL